MTEDTFSSTHPPLPPTTEEERFSRLRLLRSHRVGITTFNRLMAEHGTAQNALLALPEVAGAAGVKGYKPCPAHRVEAELEAAQTASARLISLGDPDYPSHLSQISDAPPMLWAMGNLDLLRRRSVAMVGARNASSLGTRMARALSRDLGAAGCVVTSGLARGIDTAAHLAALETGTIAIMAGGVDVVYPAENTDLGAKIAEAGLRLSEQPMGLAPMARHFPKRNRLISGLSKAVVVIEAAAKSGSLITARDALDQGREVLAVPGHPFDARASGCNILIRDGAVLVRNAEDILDALPNSEKTTATELDQGALPLPPTETRSLSDTAALHTQILSRLGPSPLAEDQLIRDIGAKTRDVGPALTDLELDGKIKRQPGGLLSLTS